MTIKELREELLKYPEDTMIVMSSDGEGNNYSPLADVDSGQYIPYNTWSGELIHPDDLKDMGDGDPVDHDKLVNVVVLWPVN